MNQVMLVGRLVYDPELKTTKNGTNYLPIRIAVSRNDKERTTDFFNCKAWNKTAEFIVKYFKKGDPIVIAGKMMPESYEKQDGTKVSEIVVVINEASFTPNKPMTMQVPAEPPRDAGLPFEL